MVLDCVEDELRMKTVDHIGIEHRRKNLRTSGTNLYIYTHIIVFDHIPPEYHTSILCRNHLYNRIADRAQLLGNYLRRKCM